MPAENTPNPEPRASDGVLYKILLRARELEGFGQCYIPRQEETETACLLGHAAGLLSQEWTQIDGRDVRGYAITRDGHKQLAIAEAQP